MSDQSENIPGADDQPPVGIELWSFRKLARGAVATVAAVAIAVPLLFRGNWDHAGAFGDMFGAAGALFSGLAFAAMVRTLHLQRKELELQRQELKDTRIELERAATAQEKSHQTLEQQLALQKASLHSTVRPIFRTSGVNATDSPNQMAVTLHNDGATVRDLVGSGENRRVWVEPAAVLKRDGQLRSTSIQPLANRNRRSTSPFPILMVSNERARFVFAGILKAVDMEK